MEELATANESVDGCIAALATIRKRKFSIAFGTGYVGERHDQFVESQSPGRNCRYPVRLPHDCIGIGLLICCSFPLPLSVLALVGCWQEGESTEAVVIGAALGLAITLILGSVVAVTMRMIRIFDIRAALRRRTLLPRGVGPGIPPAAMWSDGSVQGSSASLPSSCCSTRSSAGQLLAACPRRAPEPAGDLGPLAPLGAEVGQHPLLVAEPAAVLLEQLPAGHQPAGRGGRGSPIQVRRVARLDPPIVAALGAVPSCLVGQFTAGQGHQQPDQLVGPLQVELAGRRPHEEAGHHRLADVVAVEPAVQSRLPQPDPHHAAHHRPVALQQLVGGPIIASADATDELGERRGLAHDGLPPGRCWLYTCLYPRPTARVQQVPPRRRPGRPEIAARKKSCPLSLAAVMEPGGMDHNSHS